MSNLTHLFKQYVEIIEGNSEVKIKIDTLKNNDTSTGNIQSENNLNKLNDSFLSECSDLMKYLRELRKVILIIEPEYNKDTGMTELEKDDFDTEFRLQLQQYITKFKHLQKYEGDRQQLIGAQIASNSNMLTNFINGTNSKSFELFYKSNNDFRNGVLQSLSIWINKITNQFTDMQQERLAIQRKFQSLDLNSSYNMQATSMEMQPSISLSVSQTQPQESVQDEVKHFTEAMSKLTQEQIQLLETEHEELLNIKNDQLKKVENINKTIMEVVSLQNELTSHLSVQSQNINSMMDNQDDIEVNIKQGNKQLTKAQRNAGKTAKLTTYSAIFIGILILLLDYIG